MKTKLILWTVAAALLMALGYAVPRTDFNAFMACYAGLFALYGYWVYRAPQTFQSQHWSRYLWAALGLRAVLLVAMPELSDDFWRYLWDGRLLSHGVNPYAYTPSELLEMPIYGQAHLAQLYPQLNSPDFYSVYPPVAQVLFAAATYCFPADVWGSIVAFHGLVLLLEAGTIYGLVKLLDVLERPRYWAFVYAFNPLIIIELSGNLHTESLLAVCLVAMGYAWAKKRYAWSAIALALAVGAKIIPLLLLPFVLRRLWFWKGVAYCSLVMGLVIGLFALFYDLPLLLKTRESMALYFQHFEFNGSVYYYLRYVVLYDYWRLWDYHHYFMNVTWVEESLRLDWYVGLRKMLPLATVVAIVWTSLRHQSTSSFWTLALWGFTFHLFFSTTVHPWYLTPLILWSVLTPYRFPLVWSGLIGLTYISYQGGSFVEQSWVIVVEYALLFAFVLYEQRAWQYTVPVVTPTLPPKKYKKWQQKQPSGNFIS